MPEQMALPDLLVQPEERGVLVLPVPPEQPVIPESLVSVGQLV